MLSKCREDSSCSWHKGQRASDLTLEQGAGLNRHDQ